MLGLRPTLDEGLGFVHSVDVKVVQDSAERSEKSFLVDDRWRRDLLDEFVRSEVDPASQERGPRKRTRRSIEDHAGDGKLPAENIVVQALMCDVLKGVKSYFSAK